MNLTSLPRTIIKHAYSGCNTDEDLECDENEKNQVEN